MRVNLPAVLAHTAGFFLAAKNAIRYFGGLVDMSTQKRTLPNFGPAQASHTVLSPSLWAPDNFPAHVTWNAHTAHANA